MSRTRVEECRVRTYRPGDRAEFLGLYERVWGREKGPEWFDWRFDENPHGDGVEMIVAERDGRLVGAEPLIPYRIRLGDLLVRAYQPVDWIVHPDHRREGVFTRMTEELLETRRDAAGLLFNFPTDALLPGLRKFDWRVVGPLPIAYRVHDPGRVAAARSGTDRTPPVALARASGPFVRGCLRALDRVGGTPPDLSIERHASVPATDLVDAYESDPPERFHVARDEAFYEWRFDNPRWQTTTYLARRGRVPVASVVAATERVGGLRCTSLLDVQPMRGRSERRGALAALLREVVADSREADLLKAPASMCPQVLRATGFWSDDAFPLSRFGTQTIHVVRPLPLDGEPSWEIGGRDLADPDNWQLELADVDVE